ncbi:unnamed protein product [Ilex paraguariensis]|uniref:Transmembrane protein n=1 Tax=Ilex paraguariensis TaxID=185542 RepID=A0ABC8S3D5_9AQUA
MGEDGFEFGDFSVWLHGGMMVDEMTPISLRTYFVALLWSSSEGDCLRESLLRILAIQMSIYGGQMVWASGFFCWVFVVEGMDVILGVRFRGFCDEGEKKEVSIRSNSIMVSAKDREPRVCTSIGSTVIGEVNRVKLSSVDASTLTCWRMWLGRVFILFAVSHAPMVVVFDLFSGNGVSSRVQGEARR